VLSSRGLRSRLKLLIVLCIVVAAGLFSRSVHANILPQFVQSYAGDTLWAVALYLVLALKSPVARAGELMLVSLIIAFGIEFSQLYQADWINTIRNTAPFGYILGFGFIWSDLLCYTAGISAAFLIDIGIRNRRSF
jgi:hypothetical protein